MDIRQLTYESDQQFSNLSFNHYHEKKENIFSSNSFNSLTHPDTMSSPRQILKVRHSPANPTKQISFPNHPTTMSSTIIPPFCPRRCFRQRVSAQRPFSSKAPATQQSPATRLSRMSHHSKTTQIARTILKMPH